MMEFVCPASYVMVPLNLSTVNIPLWRLSIERDSQGCTGVSPLPRSVRGNVQSAVIGFTENISLFSLSHCSADSRFRQASLMW